MFTIIGADGKEYGPVSAEKLREWIASGRANAQTQCRRENEAAWSTLGSLPEFTPAFSSTQPPPSPAPSPATSGSTVKIDPKAYADALIARNGKFDFGDALGRSWNLLKSDFWPIVGVTLLMTVLFALVNIVPFGGLLLTGIFIGGLKFYFLKKMRGEAAELSDCFIGFNQMTGPLIIASLLVTLLTLAGALLLILPGIYLAVAYAFTYLLVLDHKLDFWVAMEVSRRVITANWWWMFLLIIVASILSALGTILLVIGVVLTMPLYYGAMVAAYEQLVGRPQ